MSKPYITLNIENNNGRIIVNKAILYNGIRPHILDLNKVQRVLEKYKQPIANDKIKQNRIIIDDPKIINEFLSKRVSKKIKYTGLALASISLISTLANIEAKPSKKETIDKLKNDKENVETYEQPNSIITENIVFQEIPSDHEMFKPGIDINEIEPETTPEPPKEIIPDYIYEFNFEDRSTTIIPSSGKLLKDYVEENYGSYCEKYAKMYGLDANLVKAMITQENPFNKNQYSSRSRGVTQIDSISWGTNITTYNFERGEYETVKIDANSLPNPEYAIKIGCMILSFDYNLLCQKYNDKNILNKPECIIASLPSYNKGVYGLMGLVNKYGNAYYNHISETRGGDNLYIERVLSYLPDNAIITFKNIDGTTTNVMVDNLSINLTL